MPEAVKDVYLEQVPLQENYKTILQALGEPPENGVPYPIPDYMQPNTIRVMQSIHSPLFLLIDHVDLGLYPTAFHSYNAPGKLGEGKVIVQLRRPVKPSHGRGTIIVIEGLIVNPPRGITASYSLYEDGYQYSGIRCSRWDARGNLIVSNSDSNHHRIGETPEGIWGKAARAVKSHPLLPDERLTMIKPPITRPLALSETRRD